MESINPALKPFFRGKKTVVECGIVALNKLVAHDTSANSSSQAEFFEYLCKREREYSAGFSSTRREDLQKAAQSLPQAKDILKMLVEEVPSSNQLVQACKFYLSSELFISELEMPTLTNFLYFSTFCLKIPLF